MASVTLDRAVKQYGEVRALDDVTLDIAANEFVTLLGPSGCGKSTTLKAIAGLVPIDRGAITIGGRDVTRTPINKRNIGMVFQNLALFPHMTVAENIAFGLKMRGLARPERDMKVRQALALVHLPDYGARYPHQLSGGQQQRVAIARALVINPGVLLLDEPFAALDRKLREAMQIELRDLTRRVGITAVFVTHDQEEALTLSDRIVVMNAGRVEQTGTPDAVYSRPETRFVADFMGARNIIEARLMQVAGGDALLDWCGCRLRAALPAAQGLARDAGVAAALRPEFVRVGPDKGGSAENTVAGIVTARLDQGAFITLTVDVGASEALIARPAKAEHTRSGAAKPGDRVGLSWSAEDLVILRDAPRTIAAPVAIDSSPSQQPRRIA
jgi:putative spermidine/putrescine transport system ATP-binding protein